MDLDLDDEEAFLASMQADRASGARIVDGSAPEDEPEPAFNGIEISYRPLVEEAPQAVPYEPPELTKRLCTVDTETDPFLYGRSPLPFWVGFYDGDDYEEWWGDDCVYRFFEYLVSRFERAGEELVIYAHNGGKFDFHLFMEHLDDDSMPFIINNRVAKVFFHAQEFRDSFSIIPVAQAKFGGAKLKISYDLFERDVRERHKEEITRYARHDVVSLWEIVSEYIKRFGWRLTVAGTALPYLESFHGFNKMDRETDQQIRPYYGGGRVQCFETGLIVMPPGKRLQMVDRNSMYPSAMKFHRHPVSAIAWRGKEITEETDFAYIEAENDGCLGVGSGLGYDFTRKHGRFFATIHEIRAGLDTGTLKIIRVISSYAFKHKTSFGEFVNTFYGLRLQSKANGDAMGVELYKLILNSAYGKLAMNTEHYKQWLYNPAVLPTPQYSPTKLFEEYEGEGGVKRYRCTHSPEGWRPALQRGDSVIWSRPARDAGERFLNVATAASITGAARADLWRAVKASSRVLYCDTDSLICEATSVDCDDKRLGAWKVEAEGDAALIAGKKMYAFLSLTPPKADSELVRIEGRDFYVVKKAHKGVQLTGSQIAEICGGAVIEHENMSPAYTLDGKVKFTKRRVKMTAQGDVSPVQMELSL